jgi:hypothetical protein
MRSLALQWLKVADQSETEAALRMLLRNDPTANPERVDNAVAALNQIRHDVVMAQAMQLGLGGMYVPMDDADDPADGTADTTVDGDG